MLFFASYVEIVSVYSKKTQTTSQLGDFNVAIVD